MADAKKKMELTEVVKKVVAKMQKGRKLYRCKSCGTPFCNEAICLHHERTCQETK